MQIQFYVCYDTALENFTTVPVLFTKVHHGTELTEKRAEPQKKHMLWSKNDISRTNSTEKKGIPQEE